MNTKVDWFFSKSTKWQEAYEELRAVVLQCGLTEELKWGVPCYTFNNANIVLIHGFKNYCALLFHKGALLQDRNGILVQQTSNVQSARQIRFTGVEQIRAVKTTLKRYIKEAIEVERSGKKVDLKQTAAYETPEEFQAALEDMPELKLAFEALTPGRQRGYLLYFSQPKQSKTRASRIEKYLDKILKGQGLDD